MQKFFIPRMKSAARRIIVLDEAMTVYDQDTKTVWVGDGQTRGGIQVGTGVPSEGAPTQIATTTTVTGEQLAIEPGGVYLWAIDGPDNVLRVPDIAGVWSAEAYVRIADTAILNLVGANSNVTVEWHRDHEQVVDTLVNGAVNIITINVINKVATVWVVGTAPLV